jgi:hypothetical protein
MRMTLRSTPVPSGSVHCTCWCENQRMLRHSATREVG